jgi:glycosyltransferase involved in cell wall biosynthesis
VTPEKHEKDDGMTVDRSPPDAHLEALRRERVLLVGSIPHPIGGVSQHVWRLAGRLADWGCGVCDIHPRPKKYPLPHVAHRQAPAASWKKPLWLLRQLRTTAASVVHLHCSTPAALAVAGHLLLRACGSRRTVATLHHGDLDACFQRLAKWRQRITASCLRRHSRIVCLDVIGLAPQQLVEATSYIALPSHWQCNALTNTSGSSHSSQPRVRGSSETNLRLVASGYAEPYYRHEEAIQLVDELRRDCVAELLICLYGESQDANYLQKLRQMAAQRPYVKLRFHLEFPEFLQLLSSADLLVRPTTVDSYGLVVADALELGVPAVATDVCRRHPGAVVYRAGDTCDLLRAAREALLRPAAANAAPASAPDDALPSILQAYGSPFIQASVPSYRRAG